MTRLRESCSGSTEGSEVWLWLLKTSSARGNARDSPGRTNAVDFESGNRRRDGYTALFLSRPTRKQRCAPFRDRTERSADLCVANC